MLVILSQEYAAVKVSAQEDLESWEQLVNGVATLARLFNRGAPFNTSTKLTNWKSGERNGTARRIGASK